MADTADRILADLRRRRDELKPLVGELERIEAAIDALERAEGGNGSAPRAGRPPSAPESTGRRRRRRGRPPRGEPNRTDQFLDLVRRGAISVPSAAVELGVGPNYLYRIAGTLESEGTIRKEGREYVINVDTPPSENAETLPEPEESAGGKTDGDDDDLITEEGVNEGVDEIIEE
jgi:hypothetical protein